MAEYYLLFELRNTKVPDCIFHRASGMGIAMNLSALYLRVMPVIQIIVMQKSPSYKAPHVDRFLLFHRQTDRHISHSNRMLISGYHSMLAVVLFSLIQAGMDNILSISFDDLYYFGVFSNLDHTL